MFDNAVQTNIQFEKSLGTAAPKAHPEEGSLARQGLSALRGFVGSILPSRMYGDMFLGIIFLALSIVLIICVFTNCQQLGCAMMRLAFFCCCLVTVLFYLCLTWQLSDAEFHGVYVGYAEWLITSIKNGGSGTK